MGSSEASTFENHVQAIRVTVAVCVFTQLTTFAAERFVGSLTKPCPKSRKADFRIRLLAKVSLIQG